MGFLVNLPVISQTSTAVAVGTLLVPLMLAARVSPLTTGAALLLGTSLGGELLNPGAPEVRTVSSALGVDAAACVSRIFPLLMLQLGVAMAVFWALSVRAEARNQSQQDQPLDDTETPQQPAFRVNLLKAAVPLVPVILLFLTILPLSSNNKLLPVPHGWLVKELKAADLPELSAEDSAEVRERVVEVRNAAEGRSFNSRLIGAAMLLGVVAAAFTNRRAAPATAKAFFEGAGYAFTQIISLIAIAAASARR